jgi:hypothetical protein
MNLQHDLCGLLAAFAKKSLQHINHKFHGSVIVIKQDNFIQRRCLGFVGLDDLKQIILMFRYCHNGYHFEGNPENFKRGEEAISRFIRLFSSAHASHKTRLTRRRQQAPTLAAPVGTGAGYKSMG